MDINESRDPGGEVAARPGRGAGTLSAGSLFSGVGGFEQGFARAGFAVRWQCEIDESCRDVLRRNFPDVGVIYDDVRAIDGRSLEPVDLICGGFPCQDVSVAGRRAGLDGARSGLWHEYRRILRDVRPAWCVIENVPGLLSSCGCPTCGAVRRLLRVHTYLRRKRKIHQSCALCRAGQRMLASHRGRDFAIVVRGLEELGYGVAWRVLDAQYHGVPQRRRRVFIVGHLGDGRAAEVLFESACVPGNPPPRRAAGQRVAASLTRGSGVGSNDPGRRREDDINLVPSVAGTLGGGKAGERGWRNDLDSQGAYVPTQQDISPSVTAKWAKGSGGPSGDEAQNLVPSHVHRMVGFSEYADDDRASALRARDHKDATDLVTTHQNTGQGWWNEGDTATALRTPVGGGALEANVVTHALTTTIAKGATEDGTGRGVPLVAGTIDCRNDVFNAEISGTVQTKANGGQSLNFVNPVAIPIGNPTSKTGDDPRTAQTLPVPSSVASLDLRGLRGGDGRPVALQPDLAHSLATGGGSQDAGQRILAPVAIRTAQTGSNGWGINEEGVAYTLDSTNSNAVAFAQNQRGELRTSEIAPQLTTGGGKPGEGSSAVAIPIQGTATTQSGVASAGVSDPGFGLGADGDPMFSLDASKGHAVAFRTNQTGAQGPIHSEELTDSLAQDHPPAVAFDLAQVTSAANRQRIEAGRPAPTLHEGGGAHIAFGISNDPTAKYAEEVMPGLQAKERGGGRMDAVAFHLTQDPISGETSPAMSQGNQQGCATVGVMDAVAVGADGDETGVALRANASHSGDKGDTALGPNVVAPMAVRRLMPVECERLQGWPEVEQNVIIHVWESNYTENQKSGASAEIPSHRSPKPAGNAGSGRSSASVPSAEQPSWPSSPQTGKPVALDVDINCAANVLEIRSPSGLLLHVSSAESSEWSGRHGLPADFAHLAALISITLDRTIPSGRAARPPFSARSGRHQNGCYCVGVSGREIAALASDAERHIARATSPLKSTTSAVSPSSPNSGLTLPTLCSYVVRAMSGYIPEAIQTTSSYALNLRLVSGWTERGASGKVMSDSTRYRMVGNGVATPVAEWIARRILDASA